MTLLELNDVSFGYDERMIINDISLKFDEPGLSCILGPNGVGKTTLVKCMNRLIHPDSGTVSLDGEDIQTLGLNDIARRMAYVPNSETSTFSMTVAEAILMGRHPHSSWSVSKRDLEIVEDVMGIMDLKTMANRDLRELSAGQAQRVMIARGLAQEPNVLILDEPTSNLDIRYQMDVMDFLRSYARDNGIIVIMVCHDLNITAAYADRVVLMSSGRVFADGSARDVMTENNIREVYNVESKVIDVDGSPHVIVIPRRGQ